MKNFLFGFVFGLVSFILLLAYNEKETITSSPVPPQTLSELDKEQLSKHETTIIAKNETSSVEVVEEPNSGKPGITPISEVATNIELTSDKQNIDKIIEMLNDFSESELARIESILANLNSKTAEEQFTSESIDPMWSLKKQAELEYTFYEESALKDVGTLQSIECKSLTCLASVRVPVELELKPSHYLDWSTPTSVRVIPDHKDTDFRVVKIYISRE